MINAEVEASVAVDFAESGAGVGVGLLFCCVKLGVDASPPLLVPFSTDGFFFFVIVGWYNLMALLSGWEILFLVVEVNNVLRFQG